MDTIKCTECGEEIRLSQALTKDLKGQILKTEHEKHAKDLEAVRARLQDAANKAVEAEKIKSAEKAEKAVSSKLKQAEEERLQSDKQVKDLTEQIGGLMTELRESKKTAREAGLEAQKKLASEEVEIRKQATKEAEEGARYQKLELEKQLRDTQEALDVAKRKAVQGSQQNQGEVLELDLEEMLKKEFALDIFEEVKKGARGADIKQIVTNDSLQSAGLLLWETKNGKWQPAWVKKFRDDVREAGASIGVIVSVQMPPEFGEMEQVDKNLWAVKPGLAVVLAAALRSTILQVDAMSKMNVGKDVKMEALFGFVSGPEFRHRIEAIVENYGLLQGEIEKEKRAAQLKWSRQEKSIRAVIDNTLGMYGDLQGITNKALPDIASLGEDEEL